MRLWFWIAAVSSTRRRAAALLADPERLAALIGVKRHS